MDERFNSFNTQECIVEVEKHIGYINNISYDEGGRIDIVITDKIRNRIIIENKIYASDQYKQLKRYHSFDPAAHLIYLTLNGEIPSKGSVEGLDNETVSRIKSISYRDFIIEWLNSCKSIAVNHPLLRETITQYINLIKKITNKSLSTAMSNDIKDIIKNDSSNFIAASIISNEMNLLLENLNKDLLNTIKEKLKKRLNIEAHTPLSNNNGYFFYFFKYNDFKFYIRIGLEYGMSIWLAPFKAENNQFGVADDEQIVKFKETLKGFPEYTVEKNQNYTGWVLSKYDFVKCPISDKYKYVNQNSSDKITDDIVSEVISFITFFKTNAIVTNPEINFEF